MACILNWKSIPEFSMYMTGSPAEAKSQLCSYGAVQANHMSAAEKAGIETRSAIQGINSACEDGSGGYTQPDQSFQELSIFYCVLRSFTDQTLQN